VSWWLENLEAVRALAGRHRPGHHSGLGCRRGHRFINDSRTVSGHLAAAQQRGYSQ